MVIMTKYPHRSPAGEKGGYMETINSLFSMFDSPVPITLTPTHPPTPLPLSKPHPASGNLSNNGALVSLVKNLALLLLTTTAKSINQLMSKKHSQGPRRSSPPETMESSSACRRTKAPRQTDRLVILTARGFCYCGFVGCFSGWGG